MKTSETKIWSSVVLIVFALIIIIAANGWKTNLKLKNITVSGNRMVTTEEVLKLLNIEVGTLIYRVDLTDIQRKLLEHYYIKDAIVQRKLPNTVHIKLIERTPLVLVSGQEIMYMDEDGVVIPKRTLTDAFDLPVLSGTKIGNKNNVGKKVTNQRIQESLLLLAVMKKVNRPLYHNISEIQVKDSGDIVLYTTDGAVPIIFGHGDLAKKLTKLEAFWETVIRSKGLSNLKYIDLRYEDQIVTFWNDKESGKVL